MVRVRGLQEAIDILGFSFQLRAVSVLNNMSGFHVNPYSLGITDGQIP